MLLEHGEAAEDGTPLEYVEYFYQTDADVSSEWHRMGLAWAPNSRTIFPFGLSDDQRFSKGLTFRWIKQRLRLVGRGGLYTPTVLALGLAWLPLTQDATHGTFTIPLPVETDERSGKTTEQIHELVHRLLNHTDDEFLLLRVGPEEFRVAISGAAHTEIAGDDAVGAITLSLIQIPTGVESLVGEPN